MIRCGIGLAMLLAVSSVPARAQEQGGRDVTIALFSTRDVREVTVTPQSASTWTARCATCAHEPMTGAVHLAAPVDIYAGGALRVSDDANGETRTATGLWHLRAVAGESMDVVLTMPSERYVAEVLNAEAAANEPRESLRAMAVLVRTYALNGRHYSAAAGHLRADLCDSTQCQVMRLAAPTQVVEDAVFDTAGETLWFGGRRAEVFFSQHCGGTTEDVNAAWPGHGPLPYLRSHADLYCLKHGSAAWHAEVPLPRLEELARAEGWKLPTEIVAASVSARSPSNRALRVVFRGASGETGVVSASALRFGIGRALGWDEVRSDAFDIAVRNGALIFDGRGHGHGVGLCQTGAAEMAAEGKSSREILAFYFPGTEVEIVPGDQGWAESRVGTITLRANYAVPAALQTDLEQAWVEALRRFPLRQTVSPEVVFAPTTEIFRQMTAQPGWALASTHGAKIVLQPESILRANGRNWQATLLHEMLHVAVEQECNERTPLWLREGLVEALTGERSGGSPSAASTSTIDRSLRSSSSLAEAGRAHGMAAARVSLLIARYGLPAVRGWLRSGVPAGVD
jgi:stage II sporulation protein D